MHSDADSIAMIVGHLTILVTTIAGFIAQYLMAAKRHTWQMELLHAVSEKADAAYHEANGAKVLIADEISVRNKLEASRQVSENQ